LTESPRAVIAPSWDSSVSVKDFFQSELDTAVTSMQQKELSALIYAIGSWWLAVSSGGHQEVVARRMPNGGTVVRKLVGAVSRSESTFF
jgi:hypothetical protein